MTERPAAPRRPGHAPWRPDVQTLAFAVVGVVALAVGLAGSRPDVAVLGVPLVLAFGWGWFTRPTAEPVASLRQVESVAHTGRVRAELVHGTGDGVDAVRVRVSSPGHAEAQALLAPGTDRRVTLSLETARTGVQRVFRADHVSVASGGVLVSGPDVAGPLRVTVFPGAAPLRSLPLPPQLQGLTGPHTSRRVGDGTDLHDVNMFVPGDRLRRIDWRVSARRSLDVRTGRLGELYVRRTFATADATVVLVVDSRDNVGPDVATWGGAAGPRVDEATSLDLAREAATSLARRYLEGGDRVGLEDLALRRRPVAPAGGRKQLDRIAQRLALIAPEGAPSPRVRAPQVPGAALVVLFSTFLDDEAARVAGAWRAQAHRVVAVDVLPRITTSNLDGYALTAYQLVRLERGVRLERLRRTGVEVVHWVGDPDGHGTGRGADVDLLMASRPAHHRGRM